MYTLEASKGVSNFSNRSRWHGSTWQQGAICGMIVAVGSLIWLLDVVGSKQILLGGQSGIVTQFQWVRVNDVYLDICITMYMQIYTPFNSMYLL